MVIEVANAVKGAHVTPSGAVLLRTSHLVDQPKQFAVTVERVQTELNFCFIARKNNGIFSQGGNLIV